MNSLNNIINKYKTDIKPFKTAIFAVFIAITASFSVSIISSAGKQLIAEEMNSMGLNGMTTTAFNTEGENVTNISFYNTLDKLNEISEISPIICEPGTAVFSNGKTLDVMGWGIAPDITDIISLKITEGRMLNNSDINNSSYVCVLDKNIAETAYKRSNICGKKLTFYIGNKAVCFTVIGIVEKESNILNSLTGDIVPDFIYIPYTTMSSLSNKSAFDQIIFTSYNTSQTVSEFKQKLVNENYKYRSHTIKLTNLSSQKDQISNIAEIAFLSLFIVSCVAVVVCSMAVGSSVNTAVISRHKDIGIKISMGASRWDIAKEFLFSALKACIIGVVCGVTAMFIGIKIFEIIIRFDISMDYTLILLSVFVTITLTIVFSLAPSYNAAKMSPITALNRE